MLRTGSAITAGPLCQLKFYQLLPAQLYTRNRISFQKGLQHDGTAIWLVIIHGQDIMLINILIKFDVG